VRLRSKVIGIFICYAGNLVYTARRSR